MKGKKMFTVENLVPLGVFALGVLMMVMAIAQFVRNADGDSYGARRKANELQGEMVLKSQYMKEMSDTNQWIGRVDNDRVKLQGEVDKLKDVVNSLNRDVITNAQHTNGLEVKFVNGLNQLLAKPTPAPKFPKRFEIEVTHIPGGGGGRDSYPEKAPVVKPKGKTVLEEVTSKKKKK